MSQVIQPSQVSTINQNQGTSDAPVIEVVLTWNLKGQADATLQRTLDGTHYEDVGAFNGGGSHSRQIALNEGAWYRLVR